MKTGRWKEGEDSLGPICHVTGAQCTASQPLIAKLAAAMIACTNQLKDVMGCLDIFIKHKRKKDPERPTYVPHSTHINTVLTHTEEC